MCHLLQAGDIGFGKTRQDVKCIAMVALMTAAQVTGSNVSGEGGITGNIGKCNLHTQSLSLSHARTHAPTHPPTHTHTFNIVLSTAYTPIHTYHTLSAGNELGGDGCGLGDPFDNFGGLVAAYLAVLVIPVGENKMVKPLYIYDRGGIVICLLGLTKDMISLIPSTYEAWLRIHQKRKGEEKVYAEREGEVQKVSREGSESKREG